MEAPTTSSADPASDQPRVFCRDGLCNRLIQVTGEYSKADLAELAGMSSETVRRYLSGDGVSVKFLIAICTAYGIDADWLLFGVGDTRSVSEKRRRLVAEAAPAELFLEFFRRSMLPGALDLGLSCKEDRIKSGDSVVVAQ